MNLSYKNKTAHARGLRFFSAASTLASAMLLTTQAQALQSLDDTDLASVTGQDGLSTTISVPATGLSISSIVGCVDAVGSGCGTLTGANSDKITATGIKLSRIGLNGAASAGTWDTSILLDATGASGSGDPALRIQADWGRVRLAVDSVTLGAGTASLGNTVFDSSGSFELGASKGLFDSTLAQSRLKLHLINGTLFMRNQKLAGAPELALTNLDLLWDMTGDTVASNPGIVGIDTKGLLISGAKVNFNLAFDMLYEGAPTTELTITPDYSKDKPVLHYGMSGGLTNTELRVGGGGSWLAANAATRTPVTQGLNASFHTNIGSTFTSTVGFMNPALPDTQTPASLTLGTWAKMYASVPASKYDVDFPLLVLDIIKTPSQGPGGLCWGANGEGTNASCAALPTQYLDVAPENDALALLVRDGYLRAYSTTAKIGTGSTQAWSLLATMGNIDGNIYLYPDARPGKNGIKLDALLTSQPVAANTWGDGTHFMFGDGATGNAVGLLHSSLLVAADNLYVNFLSTGISIGDTTETLSPVRIALNGSLGLGNLNSATATDIGNRVKIADIKLNLEFDRFNLTLSPGTTNGKTELGFAATLRFANLSTANFADNSTGDPGTYFSWAEPGLPNQSLRLTDIQGWMALRNGRAGIAADRLYVENDILIGKSASNVNGDVLKVSKLEIGLPTAGTYGNLGQVVIPGGQFYSRVAIGAPFP